jgi:hypothetical protein
MNHIIDVKTSIFQDPGVPGVRLQTMVYYKDGSFTSHELLGKSDQQVLREMIKRLITGEIKS